VTNGELLRRACLAARQWYESLAEADPEHAPELLAYVTYLRKYMETRWGTSSTPLEEVTKDLPTMTLQELKAHWEKDGVTMPVLPGMEMHRAEEQARGGER